MRSVGQVLEQNRGIGPGFDCLRISLAVLILFTHSSDIVSGDYSEYAAGPWQIPVRALVPMFFVLSGFLITGSAQRLRLSDFVLNRAMRIVPALVVDIIVAACVIGPLFTNLNLRDYFTDPRFVTYFSNVFGAINYTLPGVFTENVNPNTVNGSLWTVPFEIGCYVIMAAAIVSGVLNNRRLFALSSAIFSAIVLAIVFASGKAALGSGEVAATNTTYLANFFSAKHGYYLYFYFLAGCAAYLFRDRLPLRGWMMVVSCICVFLISISGFVSSGLLLTKLLACLPFLTYMTIFIGMTKIPPIPLYHRGDYSYGVYLYGFPLQQSLVALFPGRFNLVTHFLVSLAVATGVAMLSWHFVEKPLLAYRRKFSFTARKTDPPSEQRLPEPEPGSALKSV